MKITSATFSGSITNIYKIPFRRLPEIAFAGRSNVGKSSLINSLVNRKNLALTSSTPGKTRVINYYCVNEKYYLVDLPGYGYAKVPLKERQQWHQLVEKYLANNSFLKGVITVIDSRHGITKLDHELIRWLTYMGLSTIIVATKIDKLPHSKTKYIIQKIAAEGEELNIAGLIPFSFITGQGKGNIWPAILNWLTPGVAL